jgi:hypothetical protein
VEVAIDDVHPSPPNQRALSTGLPEPALFQTISFLEIEE